MRERDSSKPKIITDLRPSPEACAIARKLGAMTLLSDEEIEFLEGLHSNKIKVPKGVDFIVDGHDFNATFIVSKGWAVRYALTQTGRRQILSFALPGDILGLHVNFRRTATYSAAAMTDLELAVVEPLRMIEISQKFPVLAAGLSWCTAREFAILGDQAVRLGRLTARERIGHLILELWHRLRLVGLNDNEWMPFPMTQNDLADTLGLSVVHVNRQLQQLRGSGLIQMERNRVRISALEKLIDESHFEPQHLAAFKI